MKIINSKQKALQELRRISQRTTSGDNKKINGVKQPFMSELSLNGQIVGNLQGTVYVVGA